MGKRPTPRKPDESARIVDTALDLAATQGWRDTTLADIAAAAGLPLAEVYRNFTSKPAILAAFSRRIDFAMLAGDDPELLDQPPRDRLFDVMMRRFDALAPHKEALRVIVREAGCDPLGLVVGACALRRSMAWTLEAARIDSSGLSGTLRVKGLALVYLSTLRVWLEDESEDLARTMATLDRRLRQAEGLMALARRRPRPAPA